MNQHEKAFAELAQCETLDRANLLVYEFRAKLHAQRDDFQNALEECDRLVRIAPCDEASYAFRAQICLQSGDVDGALADLEQAELFSTEQFRVRGFRAQILLNVGRIEEARAALDELLEDKPAEAFALYLRSQCWRRLGVFSDQRDDLVAALAIESDNPIFLNSLSWHYSTCPDEAFRDGEQSLRLGQKAVMLTQELNPHYLDTLAAAYAEVGQHEKACQVMRQAIALFKQHPPAQGLERYRERLSIFERGEAYRD
jgi:tetratricopeptide (TPR) repeat protein